MYCTSCKQDKVESVFNKGTSNFKLEAIKQHENSKAHLLYLHKLESINKPETSQCLLQIKKQEFENLQMQTLVQSIINLLEIMSCYVVLIE